MPNLEVDEFFNVLYQKMKDEILMYIIARCGDTEDIQDIFQETFLEVARLLKNKGIAYFRKPEAIVMTIARRKVYQHFNLRQKLGIDKICYEPLENVEEEMTDFDDFTLEDAMVRKETLEQIKEILGKQDILTRKIFYLRFYMDVSIEEVAELLGISTTRVKNRLYRTLKRIKRKLEEGVDDHEKQ